MKSLVESINESLVNEARDIDFSDLNTTDLLKVNLLNDKYYPTLWDDMQDRFAFALDLIKDLNKFIDKEEEFNRALKNRWPNDDREKPIEAFAGAACIAKCKSMAYGTDFHDEFDKLIDDYYAQSSYYNKFVKVMHELVETFFDQKYDKKYFKNEYSIDGSKLLTKYNGYGSRQEILKQAGIK